MLCSQSHSSYPLLITFVRVLEVPVLYVVSQGSLRSVGWVVVCIHVVMCLYSLVSSESTWHVSHVQKRVSKIVNFEGKILQKMDLSELTTNVVFFRDVSGL